MCTLYADVAGGAEGEEWLGVVARTLLLLVTLVVLVVVALSETLLGVLSLVVVQR